MSMPVSVGDARRGEEGVPTPTPPFFPHPDTGAELVTLADFQKALVEVEDRLSPLYRLRTQLRDAMTERFEAPLPTNPRNRTVAQAMVARCPRCRREIESES